MEHGHDTVPGGPPVGTATKTAAATAGNSNNRERNAKDDGATTTAAATTTRRFRSVLPHEPLPIESNTGRGYVHLQGAFEPKRKNKGSRQQQEPNQPPRETATEAAAATTTTTTSYWKSPKALEEALLLALRDGHERLGLPFPVLSVCAIDPNNLSRMRLEYGDPCEALRIQCAFRDQKITPHNMLSANQGDGPVFGGRACQATTITTNLLPEDASSYWPRSNPPQFRRLLHDRGNDEEERTRTRFVYVTGLIDTTNNNNNDANTNNNNTNNNIENGATVPDWWNQPYAVLGALRRVFGKDVEIFLPKRQKGRQQPIHSCHVGFRSARDAQQSVRAFQGNVQRWECDRTDDVLQSGQLFLDYATITQKSRAKQKGDYEKGKGEASRPECTSVTSAVHVPGLAIVEDFLTEDEERILVAVLTGPHAPWATQQSNKSETGAVKRLVQHYGYVFDYRTSDVLRRGEGDHGTTPMAANCPAMPAFETTDTTSIDDLVREGRGWDVLARIVERTRQHDFGESLSEHERGGAPQQQPRKELPEEKRTVFPDLNQMTVNRYKPGEGIGSHVDTLSAFGDGLISISLNSGIVMEFTKTAKSTASGVRPKKLVYLPRRSLVLMSGPSRFEWEHQIVTRRTDTHNGVVLPRGVRISLTLRTALSKGGGDPLPRFESRAFPPIWGGCGGGPMSEHGGCRNALVTPATERDHVHAVYDAIATQWHHTRGKRGVLWPSATLFVQGLPGGSIVADVGCGDGKYFPAIWEAGSYVIGTDISLPLLETSSSESSSSSTPTAPDSRRVSPHRAGLQKRPAVAVADCMSVPLRTDSCDAAICIAVMHHLSTTERRIRCLQELSRIVRPKGRIHVQAWAMEQASDSRRRFAATDVFVPFNAQPKYLDRVSQSENGKGPKPEAAPGNCPKNNDPAREAASGVSSSKSVAELYSEAYEKADFDERKGLVVFQRYCHMYREGELDDLVKQVPGVDLIESGYESGNHFVILEVA